MSLLVPPIIHYDGPEENKTMYIRRAMQMIEVARSMCTPDMPFRPYGRRYHNDSIIRIDSISSNKDLYQDIIHIKVPGGKKMEYKYEYQQMALLVEMASEGESYDMKGYVVFVPSKEDGKLHYAGWYNGVKEVTDENRSMADPLGCIDQVTYRLGWAYQEIRASNGAIPSLIIEQAKRVDQGFVAYDGEEEDEEVTMIESTDGSWTYEGCRCGQPGEDIARFWDSVDPGPPDVGMCGYTWEIDEAYGGPGGGDYSDLRHLFYLVESPGPPFGDLLIAWWPPEFNQLISYYEDRNIESAAYCSKDFDAFWGYPFWYNGLNQDVILAGTFAKVKVVNEWDERHWGVIYGTSTFSADESPAIEGYPYLSPVEKQTLIETIQTDYDRWFPALGVYVKTSGGLPSKFIVPVCRVAGVVNTTYYSLDMREKQIIEETIHPTAVPSLTDRQIELIETGNEDADEFWTDYWSTLGHCEISHTIRPTSEVCVNCGGIEYPIFNTRLFKDFVWSNGYTHDQEMTDADFPDVGIFSKFNKGIKGEKNTITESEVDPAYVYSVEDISNPDYNTDIKVAYGMVLDGVNYLTEWYDADDEAKVYIPEASGAVDGDKNPIFPTKYVRAGIMKGIFIVEDI